MKTSVKKLLSSIQFNIIVLLFLLLGIGSIFFSATATFDRIGYLQEQEKLVKKLLTLDRKDLKFSQIESDGILKQLSVTVDRFSENIPYEFVNEILIHEEPRRKQLVNKLKLRFDALAQAAESYFSKRGGTLAKRTALQKQVDGYLLALYPLARLQLQSLHRYFLFVGIGLGLLGLWILLTWTVAKQAGRTILSDLTGLMTLESSRSTYKFKTTELNSVALKLRQHSGSSMTAAKQDPVTQLLNYDGLKQTYEQRLGNVRSSHVYLCVFSVDGYTKLVNHYPASVIDPILLKIASIMKLHKQQNDLLARIDDEHFVAVFIRPSKERAYEDCDHIRQMVADNRFKLPHSTIPVTLSGGFATKSSSQSFDDTIKNAMEYLRAAQQKGGNYIAEIKDNTKIL